LNKIQHRHGFAQNQEMMYGFCIQGWRKPAGGDEIEK
jgi:hypothetical protein